MALQACSGGLRGPLRAALTAVRSHGAASCYSQLPEVAPAAAAAAARPLESNATLGYKAQVLATPEFPGEYRGTPSASGSSVWPRTNFPTGCLCNCIGRSISHIRSIGECHSSSSGASSSSSRSTSVSRTSTSSCGSPEAARRRTPAGTAFLHPPDLRVPRIRRHPRQLQEPQEQQQQKEQEPPQKQPQQKAHVYLHPSVQGARKPLAANKKRHSVAAVEKANASEAAAAAEKRSRTAAAAATERPHKFCREHRGPKASPSAASAASAAADNADTRGSLPGAAEQNDVGTADSSSSSSSRASSSRHGILCKALKASLAAQSLQTLTEVQKRAFPHIFAGGDALGWQQQQQQQLQRQPLGLCSCIDILLC